MAIGGALLGMGSTYVANSQKKAAQQQNAYDAAQSEQVRLYNNRMAEFGLQLSYNNIVDAADNSYQRSLEAQVNNQMSKEKAQGMAEVQQATSGVGGSSVDAIIDDINTTSGRNTSAIMTNRGNEIEQLNNQAKQAEFAAKNKKNGLEVGSYSYNNNSLGNIFDIATSGSKGWGWGQDFDNTWSDFNGEGGNLGGNTIFDSAGGFFS